VILVNALAARASRNPVARMSRQVQSGR